MQWCEGNGSPGELRQVGLPLRAMPLKDFIAKTMALLQTVPTPAEICVKNVHPLRLAEQKGIHDKVFHGLNEAMAEKP